MKNTNLPPFYVGQRVVAIANKDEFKKGDEFNVKDIKKACKCGRWKVDIGKTTNHPYLYAICNCGNEYHVKGTKYYDYSAFAPIESTFESISFKKVVEIESPLIEMKATELRIGNLFNPSIPKMVEAWMLLPESKVQFIPIPITEEWLLKFGFTKLPLEKGRNDYQGRADLNFGYPILYLNKHSYLSINCSVPNGFIWLEGFRIDCKYAHQLQNLYFALTGEELTTK